MAGIKPRGKPRGRFSWPALLSFFLTIHKNALTFYGRAFFNLVKQTYATGQENRPPGPPWLEAGQENRPLGQRYDFLNVSNSAFISGCDLKKSSNVFSLCTVSGYSECSINSVSSRVFVQPISVSKCSTTSCR